MSVTEAASSHHQLKDGVVVLLQDIGASVQEVVSKSVELSEVNTQVGDSQQLCGHTHTNTHTKGGMYALCERIIKSVLMTQRCSAAQFPLPSSHSQSTSVLVWAEV